MQTFLTSPGTIKLIHTPRMRPVHEIRRRNLARLREEVGGSWAELNRRTGRSDRDATYGQIWKEAVNSQTKLVRRMGNALARTLEEAMGKPIGWMDTEHPEANLRAADPVGRSVPLISWVEAGQMADVEDPYPPGDGAAWIPVGRKCGPRAFALTVDGLSMTNPNGHPTFPHGTVIIVDPDVSPDPGRFVVAKDVANQAATFKRLAVDGGRWFLVPLNPAFPTLEIDRSTIRIIGVVVEVRMEV